MNIFNAFGSIISSRLKQMELQKDIDNKIYKLYSDNICQKELFELLLFDRELNRQRTKEMENTRFYEYLSKTSDQLSAIDKYQTDLNNILDQTINCNSCQKLSDFINGLKQNPN